MFSLIFGFSSPRQLVLGLVLAFVGIVVCVQYDGNPNFLGFSLGRYTAYFLMILLGAIIGWPARLAGYKRWIGLTLALSLGFAAVVMLVTKHNLAGTILCLLAQIEWVGTGSKPASLKALLKPRHRS